MRITKEELKQIIMEELSSSMMEEEELDESRYSEASMHKNIKTRLGLSDGEYRKALRYVEAAMTLSQMSDDDKDLVKKTAKITYNYSGAGNKPLLQKTLSFLRTLG